MDPKIWEPRAILGKSLALIEKTAAGLDHLDHWNFPTDSSDAARKLLLQTLQTLETPAKLVPMDPSVLYNRLFSIQALAELVARSSTHHISWPLVSYCDQIWHTLFGDTGPKIFYSLTPEHNYSILRFSAMLGRHLNGLLPNADISALLRDNDLYCLQLASSEDYNLPLYANIGHEFGHAIFDHKEAELRKLLAANVETILNSIYSDLDAKDPDQATRRAKRVVWAILGFAKELFCDLVGAMLMGPSFLVSLYEISWAQNKDTWTISLSPYDQAIRAYPSFHFRLSCIRKWSEVDSFCADAQQASKRLGIARLIEIAEYLQGIPIRHDSDSLNVGPDSDGDSNIVKEVVTKYRTRLKQGLDAFLSECATEMKNWYRLPLPCVSAYPVAELLQRLEHRILPNVIPDETLLGKPATFAAILNACALYRLHLLADVKVESSAGLARDTAIIERLTAKAFEVSFIQTKYNNWSGT